MLRERKTFVNLADPQLKGQFSEKILCKAVEVAVMCLREDPHSRPSMTDVVNALSYLASLKYDPNNANGSADQRSLHKGDAPCKIKLSMKISDRELAVAEAKIWGKTCREKRLQSVRNDADDLNR